MANPSLKQALRSGALLKAPGVFDGLSARIADTLGFPALYMTGYGVSASLLGKPDAGYLTASHMADRVRVFCSAIHTPLIADADTGFGGILNVQEAVHAYETGGASAIQIEDQEFPKRCGHTRNRRVIDIAQAEAKIDMAVQSRNSSDFLIVARTDARTSLGLDEALRRAERFLQAGADIIFIESPQSEDELARIGKAFAGSWLLANMVDGGLTPRVPAARLAELGFRITIYPLDALAAVAACLTRAYTDLAAGETVQAPRASFAELNRIVGFEQVWALDARQPGTNTDPET